MTSAQGRLIARLSEWPVSFQRILAPIVLYGRFTAYTTKDAVKKRPIGMRAELRKMIQRLARFEVTLDGFLGQCLNAYTRARGLRGQSGAEFLG